ncbi:cold shock domain-containing protein [Patescibacteria group bacterium]|nr:cold shock domain-containing protein [Patescibacteria group bacterium]
MRGTVKFFNTTKGFGFIKEDGSEAEHFVHVSNVTNGTGTLAEGQTVEFEIREGRNGKMEAYDVR